MKSRRLWVILSVAAIGAAGVGLLSFPPTSTFIFHRQQDINIKTGQARYSRYILTVKVSEVLEDTPFSVALGGQTIDVAPIQAWHPVNTFPIGWHHSLHYVFHGALSQGTKMTLMSEVYHLTPAQRTEMAREVLTRWQTTGGDSAAEKYLQEVGKTLRIPNPPSN
jgi:hypothetical protein